MKYIKYLVFLIILFPVQCFAIVTREEYNNAVANVSIDTAHKYQDDFVYSYYWGGTPDNPVSYSYKLNEGMRNAFKGIKTESGYIYGTMKTKAGIQGSYTNKFPVYCLTFVKIMVYHASNGQASFDYANNDSYEKIKVGELKRGDIIDYKSHIAIFLDDGGDDNDNTWHVAEASSKVQERIIKRDDIEGAFRVKDSVLLTLDPNAINSSYDFHDRLDDAPPTIDSVEEISNSDKIRIKASDYKQYELLKRSDILEPESNGIIAYQVTTSSSKPTSNWKSVDKTTVLNVEEKVSGNGTHYVYVKDVGGNVTVKQVNLTNIVVDRELPTLGSFTYEGYENSIKVIISGARDNKGIKEYRYYLNNSFIESSSNSSYTFKNLDTNKEYSFHYEVVDYSDNVNKSEFYRISTQIDAKEIIIPEDAIYLLKNETYQLNPQVVADTKNYKIKYQSSNELVATVTDSGLVKTNNTGECNITISVGKTNKNIKVKVSTYKIDYKLNQLPEAFIGKEYNVLIETNYDSTITLDRSVLPDGLVFNNNRITGIPKENTNGEYNIKFISKYLDSESPKEYKLIVKYKLEFQNNNLKMAYIDKEYNEELKLNYPGEISLVKGTLPDGIKLVDNKLVGTPSEMGNYSFSLKAVYKNTEIIQDFSIKVTNSRYIIYICVIICIIVILLYSIFKPKKKIVRR